MSIGDFHEGQMSLPALSAASPIVFVCENNECREWRTPALPDAPRSKDVLAEGARLPGWSAIRFDSEHVLQVRDPL